MWLEPGNPEYRHKRREGREREMSFFDPVKKKLAGSWGDPEAAGAGGDIAHENISPRTWFFFYLICLVAILWATFLLVREEMVWLSFALVIIAAGSGMFLFMHDVKLRTWFFFYLICLVAILWAVFLLMQEELAWVSMFLVIVSVGIAIFAYFLCEYHLETLPDAPLGAGSATLTGDTIGGPSETTGVPVDLEEI
jgi:hypothetical protein